MNKFAPRIFSLALTLIAVLAFTQCAKSQTGPGVTVAVTSPHPAWQGKAGGDARPFERNNDDLQTALAGQPVPDVWLEFAETGGERQSSRARVGGNEGVIKVTLPLEAKTILKSFWEEALKFGYAEAFVKARKAEDRLAWISYYETSAENLEQVEIDAPDGRRAISEDEAREILIFARKAAFRLVEKAKEN